VSRRTEDAYREIHRVLVLLGRIEAAAGGVYGDTEAMKRIRALLHDYDPEWRRRLGALVRQHDPAGQP
jgi:hypothetical protein